ncbi:MAG: hypothetical protein CV088_10135 [Nitrospira sp. LK70]|nr:hypothetical protein [Nitrospira sp. LK70]
MHKLIGALFMSVLLFEGQAFSQGIIPSKVQPINPTVTEYFHIFSCYDSFTGNLLDCRVKDGLNPPGNDPGSKGGHTHGGTFPLTDLSQGQANGFVCIACTDSNSDPHAIDTQTSGSVAIILHRIPQFAGRILVTGFIIPPPGWVCITGCNFNFTEAIGVDGLGDVPLTGQNYRVVRSPASVTLHERGAVGTSDAVSGVLGIAQDYFQVTGRGLSVNDLSLPRGGKFDLAAGYAEGGAHASHRTGKDADFNSTDLGGRSINCLTDKQYQVILDAHNVGYRVCHTDTGGSYHVRFK